jgi:hypothetical protein
MGPTEILGPLFMSQRTADGVSINSTALAPAEAPSAGVASEPWFVAILVSVFVGLPALAGAVYIGLRYQSASEERRDRARRVRNNGDRTSGEGEPRGSTSVLSWMRHKEVKVVPY